MASDIPSLSTCYSHSFFYRLVRGCLPKINFSPSEYLSVRPFGSAIKISDCRVFRELDLFVPDCL